MKAELWQAMNEDDGEKRPLLTTEQTNSTCNAIEPQRQSVQIIQLQIILLNTMITLTFYDWHVVVIK